MPTLDPAGVRRRRTAAVATAGAALLAVAATAGTSSAAVAASSTATARADSYRTSAGHTLTVTGQGVLANDKGDVDTVVAHTATAHGTLALAADGSFSYTPEAGFTGTDTFTYTTTPAVHLYRTHVAPLATIGGTTITGGAFGSAIAPVPGESDEIYGLTDRGPNVDGPDGTKIEPITSFTPAIGRFRLVDGQAKLVRTIALRAQDGSPFTGQVDCQASTGETITDLNGTVLPCSAHGLDPEGLVALKDGTFWVSDEYGPFIVHFDRTGREIERLSPYDGTLPAELLHRTANKGMEGLTITPDGRTLVGVMQAALTQADTTKKSKNIAPVRIVTVDLRSRAVHEYLYLLHDPATTSTAVSEITALSATHLLVDERDGDLLPTGSKRLYDVNLTGATDIGPAAAVAGSVYDGTTVGLKVGTAGLSIEATVGTAGTAAATTILTAAGITPAASTLSLDVTALLTGLAPDGTFFGHDKVEGVVALHGGRTLIIANDSDFGISGTTTTTAPFGLAVKTLPDGTQDDGEYLQVDTRRLPAQTTTGTVTIRVS